MSERRRSRRRTIPFLRGGVLQVGERSHIVTIVDLSPEGAYLASRVQVAPGRDVRLKTVLPRSGRQVTIPCEVVWRSTRFEPTTGRPAGVAVRFVAKDEKVQRHLETLSDEGLLPLAVSATQERFEYRFVDVPELDLDDLNRMGRDGWALVSTEPQPAGLRLLFRRRI
jgi:Tfp pilus assembly protein PilZ